MSVASEPSIGEGARGAPRGRRTWWTLLKVALLGIALYYAARALGVHWNAVRERAAGATLGWSWIALASVVALATHAMLVEAWRRLLGGWDAAPPYWRSVRVWTIANLGRYIPGKVWSIGALGALARQEGVSGIAAASAAILGTLINIGAGFGIAALAGSAALRDLGAWVGVASRVAAGLFIVGTLLLPRVLPPVVDWIAARRGLPPVDRHVSARLLWGVTAINVLSWIGYGIAFWLLARGVTPELANAARQQEGGSLAGVLAGFVTVYTVSYLWGYLVLIAPGGIGVREWALVTMLGALGFGSAADAWFLVLASRVWITVLEIVPGVLSLLVNPHRSRAARQRTG